MCDHSLLRLGRWGLRTFSWRLSRSFVSATPVMPGWKGGVGLPKGSQAMWSPVSLLTTWNLPTTWFSQMTGCCWRLLVGDLHRGRVAVSAGRPAGRVVARAARGCAHGLARFCNYRYSRSSRLTKSKTRLYTASHVARGPVPQLCLWDHAGGGRGGGALQSSLVRWSQTVVMRNFE